TALGRAAAASRVQIVKDMMPPCTVYQNSCAVGAQNPKVSMNLCWTRYKSFGKVSLVKSSRDSTIHLPEACDLPGSRIDGCTKD
ncbi:unnamed protein product, partial [Urochloa humidicola]